MTNIEILSEISGLLPSTIEASYKWVLEAMTAAREEGRREGAVGFAEWKDIWTEKQMGKYYKSRILSHPLLKINTEYNIPELYDLYIQSLQNYKL